MTSLNDLRVRIYQNLKSKAYSLEGEVSDELLSYREDQEKASQRPFTPSNIDELKDQVANSDVIYLGDFHTFDQNIRNVLRILKSLVSGSSKVVIALEMVAARFQFQLEAYMERHLTELEFLESIDYHESWRFPWTHYKLVFDLAKEHDIKMIALNTKGALGERDAFAAAELDRALSNYPGAKIVVVYGELHIGRDKIPARLEKLRPNIQQTIIHQNLDEVYWTMRQESQEDKIVKFSEAEFCINSAPPWIKYESMIYWYENLTDDPDFDIHEYIIEKGKKIFSEDTQENFLLISRDLAQTANLIVDEDELENFNLYDHTGLEYIQEKIENIEDKELSNFYQNLASMGESFRLPDDTSFYCSSYSMNRISYLAGINILRAFRSADSSPSEIAAETLSSGDREGFFARFAFECLHAFFFSKIMNPHRKCDMYWNLKQAAASEASPSRASVLRASKNILDGQPLNSVFKGLDLNQIHNAAQITGHILGEYLYAKSFHMPEEIHLQKDFLEAPFSAEGFQHAREILLKGVNYRSHKKRYF